MSVKLYRFYNMQESRHGEPFALCDKHMKTQIIPYNCDLQKIANDTDWPCNECETEAFK